MTTPYQPPSPRVVGRLTDDAPQLTRPTRAATQAALEHARDTAATCRLLVLDQRWRR